MSGVNEMELFHAVPRALICSFLPETPVNRNFA